MSPDQIYCKIIEYEISFPNDINNLTKYTEDKLKTLYIEDYEGKDNFSISVIGMKVVLFNNFYNR